MRFIYRAKEDEFEVVHNGLSKKLSRSQLLDLIGADSVQWLEARPNWWHSANSVLYHNFAAQ